MGNKRGAAAPKIVRWWFVLHPDRKAHRVGRGPQAHAPKDAADLPVDDENRSEWMWLFALFNMERKEEEEEA